MTVLYDKVLGGRFFGSRCRYQVIRPADQHKGTTASRHHWTAWQRQQQQQQRWIRWRSRRWVWLEITKARAAERRPVGLIINTRRAIDRSAQMSSCIASVKSVRQPPQTVLASQRYGCNSFYPNVTCDCIRYVRVFAIANPSVVCNVCVPGTQGVETFGNISSPFCTLAIRWRPCKILRRLSQAKPFIGGFKRKPWATLFTVFAGCAGKCFQIWCVRSRDRLPRSIKQLIN